MTLAHSTRVRKRPEPHKVELDHLYRMAPVGLCLMDRHLRFLHLNQRMAALSGLPILEHIGRRFGEVLPGIAGQVEPILRRVVETGVPILDQEFQGTTPRTTSEETHWLVGCHPLKADDGTVLELSIVVQDITRQKKAEQTLLESEARFRTLVEHSAEAICVLDATSGRFADVNQKAQDLFGLTHEELLTVGPAEVSPPFQPDGRPSVECVREKLAAAVDGTQLTFEWTHRHSGGREIPCEVRLVRLPATGRDLFRGSITDITERRFTEQARHRDEERLRLVLETTNAIPWEIDTGTRQFTYVGPQAARVLGYPLEHWYRDGFWESHLSPEDRERAIYLCRESKTSLRDYEIEYRMISASGEIVWLHDLVTVESNDGVQTSVRGLMLDVTARKRAELLQEGLTRVLERLAMGEQLSVVLTELTLTIDLQQTGMRCSILLLDDDGMHLRHQAGPGLPEEYNRIIDGIEIGPNAGSCGSAAYLGQRVVVTDTLNDPLWKDFRDLALRFNLRACWSQPILSGAGKVLGTFAIYHDRPSRPSEFELGLIEQAAYLAGVAIERTRANQALRESEAALRQSHEDLQHLTGRLLNAQEEEHRRLARELHDDLTQRLAVLAIEAAKMEEVLSSSPARVRERVRGMKERLAKLSEDVHGISRQLHPSILDDLGLVDALASECSRFSDREGIEVDFRPDNIPRQMPRDVSICLYRIVQEGLRNIAKHSRARDASITLAGANGTLNLVIRDSGVGFDPALVRGRGGLGLASMEERVRLLHGNLSVHSEAGGGTTIELRVDLPGDAG